MSEANKSIFSQVKKFGKKKPTVLLVDDDRDQLMIFQAILERADLKVITADSACRALLMLDNADINLVVCDVNMPEMSGKELVSNIRKTSIYSSLPVISFSADMTHSEEDLLDIGADCYLQKAQARRLVKEVSSRLQA